MKTTLKDLLHSINVLEEDVDVIVDGLDAIAVCPPVKITPEGVKKFEKTLNIECDSCLVGGNSSEEECEEAWEFLASLAGYCECENYDKWFDGETSKVI